MQRIKMMLLALIAVFAIGSIGATAAGAASGTVAVDDGDPCDIEFDYSGVTPPATGAGTISNVAASDCEYEGNPIGVSGGADVEAISDGSATLSGTFTISVTVPIFGAVQCVYEPDPDPMMGTWVDDSGPPVTRSFTFSGTARLVGGSPPFIYNIVCPDPISVTIQATVP